MEQGFAYLREGRPPPTIAKELEEAEKSAQEKRVGVWSLPGALDLANTEMDGAEEAEEKKIEIPECIVSVKGTVNDFYIQEAAESRIEALQEEIRSYVSNLHGAQAASQAFTPTALPKAGDFVLSQFSEDGGVRSQEIKTN